MMLLSCSGAALNRLNQVLSWTTILSRRAGRYFY
jgi:hypothetical protein